MENKIESRKMDGYKDKGLATDMELDEVFIDTSNNKGPGEELGNPFRRKNTLMRTPPPRRTLSLPGERSKEFPQSSLTTESKVDGEEEEAISNKESTRTVATLVDVGKIKRPREDSEEDLKDLKKMFTKLKNVINDLTKEVHQNTRVEIKKGIKVAKGQADEIVRKWDALTLHLRERKKSKRMEESDEGVTVVKDVRALQKEITVKRSIATQVAEDMISKEVGEAVNTETRKIQAQLGRKEGWKGCESLLDQKWPEEVFVHTSIHGEVGRLNNEEVDIAVMVDPKIGIEGKALEKVRDSFRDLERLIAEGLTGIEYIRKKTQIESSRGEGIEKNSTLYVLPVETGCTGANMKTETEQIYNLLEEVKARVIATGRDRIKLIPHEGIQDQYLRKCMEAALVGSTVKGEIIITKKRNTKKEEEGKKKVRNARQALVQRSKVIVKMEGCNYADTLKRVKEKINPDSMEIKINKVKRTMKGDLLLEIDGGVENANKLKSAIDKGMEEGISVEHVKTATSIMIWGIEPDTSEAQILEALESKVGRDAKEDIKVTSLRPTKSGNLAASVSVNKRVAKDVLKNGVVRIGWSQCKMRERINILRCFRCLEYGHRTVECKGEDRANQCLNCGKENHIAKDCVNASYCNTCKVGGHRADQMTCPEFRKIINRMTEEGRKRTRGADGAGGATRGGPRTRQ